jgi:2Fe-2S ferredoxin
VPIVEILPSAAHGAAGAGPDGPRVLVEGDGPLVDLCDDVRAPVELSCRGASCGTCRVEVIEGAGLLDPPGADEQETLRRISARPGHRLACQAHVRPGAGHLVLRWVGARWRSPA